MQIDGSCHCGAITFTADIDESQVLACNCTDCQVQSGSAFSLSMLVARAALAVTKGETRSWRRRADSGRMMSCVFCPECGAKA